jgi:hypothetical protein
LLILLLAQHPRSPILPNSQLCPIYTPQKNRCRTVAGIFIPIIHHPVFVESSEGLFAITAEILFESQHVKRNFIGTRLKIKHMENNEWRSMPDFKLRNHHNPKTYTVVNRVRAAVVAKSRAAI